MSQDLLDLDNLKFLRELLADRFPELIDTYLRDSSDRFAALKVAVEDGDMSDVAQQSHGLKGSSRNIGANALGDLCETMEGQARQGALADGQQQLAAIEKNLAAVVVELEKLN